LESPGSLVPQDVAGTTEKNVGLVPPEKLTVFSRQSALQHWFERKNLACKYDVRIWPAPMTSLLACIYEQGGRRA
jgi:hypothetical protein